MERTGKTKGRIGRIGLLLLSYYLMLPGLTRAAVLFDPIGTGETPTRGGGLKNPLKSLTIDAFLEDLLGIVVRIGFPFVVLAVIYTGFLFVSARGNEQKLTDAKNAFLWTVIGALIVLAAAAISQLIEGTVSEITKGL